MVHRPGRLGRRVVVCNPFDHPVVAAAPRLAELLDGRSDIRVTRQLVETAEDAERLGFHGSPTVIVDGVDPFADEHTPVGLACRVFRTPAGLGGSPTVEQLREAISGPALTGDA